MKMRVLWLLGLLLAVAIVARWWLGVGSIEHVPEATHPAQSSLASPPPEPMREGDMGVERTPAPPEPDASSKGAELEAAAFSGRVMDFAGNPVSAVAVELRGGSETKTCSSDSAGSFEVELTSGNWILEARHADFDRHIEIVEWVDTSRAPPHEIRLRAIRLVGIRFVDEHGAPLPATLAQTRVELRPRVVAFEADDAGVAPLEHTASLRFLTKTELKAESPKDWHAGLHVPFGRVCLAQATCLGVVGPLTRIFPNDPVVQLTLPIDPLAARLASVEIRLVDAETQAPLPNVHVSLVPPEGGNRIGPTDSDGRASFVGVSPGFVTFSVWARGYATLDRGLGLEPGTSVSVEFALERAQQIHGVARYEDGTPFASRALHYFELKAIQEPKFRIASSSIRTDEEGRFTIWNTTSQPLIVVPDVSKVAGARTATLVRPDAANEVIVRAEQRLCFASDRLAPAGLELRCMVLDAAGYPVAQWRQRSPVADCWKLASGTYRVEWAYESGAPQSVNVEVPATGALHFPLHVDAPKGSSGR